MPVGLPDVVAAREYLSSGEEDVELGYIYARHSSVLDKQLDLVHGSSVWVFHYFVVLTLCVFYFL